jgi:type VI secretion system protein ImpG
MDRRLIRYYDRELRHLQTVAKEFAREFPKIAGRLSIEDFPCPDPYVERLLEGFAFLAARVQLKIDAEFPRFTQNLLETAYPHYLAPTPSMVVAQFNPDLVEPSLAEGYRIPRQSVLRSLLGKGDQTSCEYRTSHDCTLWPLVVEEVRYYTRDLPLLELGSTHGVKAALRIRLRCMANLTFNKTKISTVNVFLDGADATPARLYEQLLGHSRGVVVRPVVPQGVKTGRWTEHLPEDSIKRVGYAANEALLPYDARSFQGYRLLHEYFAFPQRYLFVDFTGLAPAVKKCDTSLLDVIVLLDQDSPDLERSAISKDNFRLHCAPAINLFPKRADRIFVSDRASEFQVVPDKSRPLDFEVYRVLTVTGFQSGSTEEKPFSPFYAATDAGGAGGDGAYYAVSRVPRAMSDREQRYGRRSSYAGSEVYLSLVDADAAPFSGDLRQLAVETLCTNRDLPLQMPIGKGKTDFSLDIGAPLENVRAVAGPTPPRPTHAEGEMSWRLISHLSLNYLSLIDTNDRDGAAALRDLMRLYGDAADPVVRKQIEAVRSVSCQPIVRRLPMPGPITYARGLEVKVTLDEQGFEGTGVFTLGSVLEHFFARYVSLNSFTESVVETVDHGEVMRWTARLGQRPIF